MSDEPVTPVLSPETVENPADAPIPSEAVQQPAKVMRIGAMIRHMRGG